MLYPRRRVLAVCGDGGFMMNSQEMETAVRLSLNLVVLVLQDDAYGMIRWKQEVDGFPGFRHDIWQSGFRRLCESALRERQPESKPQTGWYRLWKRHSASCRPMVFQNRSRIGGRQADGGSGVGGNGDGF